MIEDKKIQPIDLERTIHNKNPKLLKRLPGFVRRYMKIIVHQDELNDFLGSTENILAHDFVTVLLEKFQIRVISEGAENIPEQGGCIIVCNHPLGGIDGLAVMNEVGKKRKDIKALVNDILMTLQNMSSLLIPINMHEKNLTESLRRIEQVFASEECVIVFPAGLVSRRKNGTIKDLDWKKSFIAKAIKYKHNVIPVYVDGRNSNFFYNLATIRKTMGIKANLEMFYLVDEVFKQRGKFIKLFIGAPIPYTVFTKAHTNLYWAEKVKEHVYALKHNKKVL